jgi:gliding motility associated protien GldN
MKNFSLIILVLFTSIKLYSQAPQSNQLLFKKEIVRAIDLREKQNEPLFSADRELTTLLLNATLSGSLTPYSSDSLSQGKQLTISEFRSRITIDNGEIEQDTAYMDQYEKMEYLQNLLENENNPDYFFGKDLYQLELSETLYFSKNSSEMRHHTKSITVFLPAEHPDNIRGIQQPIATYDFAEILNAFEGNPDAIWYNPKNSAEHHPISVAFELRLFSSYIIKVANPNDEYLVDIYGGNERTGIIKSLEKDVEFLEFESNLWEN